MSTNVIDTICPRKLTFEQGIDARSYKPQHLEWDCLMISTVKTALQTAGMQCTTGFAVCFNKTVFIWRESRDNILIKTPDLRCSRMTRLPPTAQLIPVPQEPHQLVFPFTLLAKPDFALRTVLSLKVLGIKLKPGSRICRCGTYCVHCWRQITWLQPDVSSYDSFDQVVVLSKLRRRSFREDSDSSQ